MKLLSLVIQQEKQTNVLPLYYSLPQAVTTILSVK